MVERLVNSLMMHGRNNGKKLLTVRIVKHSFEIIHLLTGENPLQILVNAVINSGPREDSTRIGRAGTVRRQAVDVSPLRRVNQVNILCIRSLLFSMMIHPALFECSMRTNFPYILPDCHLHACHIYDNQNNSVFSKRTSFQAIWLLCTGAREAAFRNIKTIAECLADELINAAKGSSNSYAIKKKDELERVAKSNR